MKSLHAIPDPIERLTLEQRERHGEEERPGADLALRQRVAAGVRVQVVAEAGHEVEIERGRHDDDDRDEEEEVEAERLDVLKKKEEKRLHDVVRIHIIRNSIASVGRSICCMEGKRLRRALSYLKGWNVKVGVTSCALINLIGR